MPKLAILTHRDDARNSVSYLVDVMAPSWRADGIEVEWLRGHDRFVAADAVMLHVDLTRVPPGYLDFVRRYPVAINGATGDISKRRISRQRLLRGDDYRQPVIVKTIRNYGGIPERLAIARRRGPFGSLRRACEAALSRLPWTWSGRFAQYGYPIFDHARAVPWMAWLHPNLIVEKLLVERDGPYFCVRRWTFLGAREVTLRMVYRSAVSRPSESVAREICEPPPAELRALRRELGFDYGKFDYAMVNGHPVLYDANRTTSAEFIRLEPRLAGLADELAPGIWDFLPRPRAR